MKLRILFLFLSTLFLTCSDTNVADLNVTFDDPNWDGAKVPKVGQCKNCGGEGLSPALRIKNIPPDTGLIIIEFNDKSLPALSKGGGHGAISFKVENKNEIIVPSIGEQTFDLPEGIKMESEHRASLGEPGAYMAPCGCGNENKYEATIFALKNDQSGKRMTVGKGKIFLGKF